jgi:hypothetical protein
MKKVKYYYSEAVHLRTMSVITDAEGNPMYIPDTKPIKIKNLPRITVAAIWDTKQDRMTFAAAICAPNDTFKKSIGREVALKRATEFPEISIRLMKKNRIREVSKRYANQLISQHLHKYVRADI